MAHTPPSFIDAVALEAVRERFARGDALVLLPPELDEVLWANGAGAALLGFASVAAAVGAPVPFDVIARRQVWAASGFPKSLGERPAAVRLVQRRDSRTLFLRAATTALADGSAVILLSQPAPNAAEGVHLEQVIAGIAQPGAFVALMDGSGHMLAASPGFADLGLAPERLAALAAELTDGKPLKRMVPGPDRATPVGLARLTENMFLLVAVDEEAAAPLSDRLGAQPEPEPPAEPAPAELAPAEPSPTEAERRLAEWRMAPALRFTWQLDPDTRFVSISPEFLGALDLPADTVVGRSWEEISQALDLDPDGKVAALLAERHTWSGRTVHWPAVHGALAVPVDLAALPTFNRARAFGGYRGFGVARLAEAALRPQGEIESAGLAGAPDEGLAPDAVTPAETVAEPTQHGPSPETLPAPAQAAGPAAERSREQVLAGGVAPERGRPALAPHEHTAFREIGEKLRDVGGAARGIIAFPAAPAQDLPVAGEAAREVSENGLASAAGGEPSEVVEVPRSPDGSTAEKTAALRLFPAPAGDESGAPSALRSELEVPLEDGRAAAAHPELAADAVEVRPESSEGAVEPLQAGDGALPDAVEREQPEPVQSPEGKIETAEQAQAGAPAAPGHEAQTQGERDGATELAALQPLTLADAVSASAEAELGAAVLAPPEAAGSDPPKADAGAAVQTVAEIGHASLGHATHALQVPADGDLPVGGEADGPATDAAERDASFAGDDSPSPTREPLLPSGGEGPRSPRPWASDGSFFLPRGREAVVAADTSLLDRLPIPVLIHGGDVLHYANEEFFALTGFADLAALEAAGGLDALFCEPSDAVAGERRRAQLLSADGRELPAEAILRAVPWRGGKALMLVLRRAEPDAEEAALRAELEQRVCEMRTILDTATDGVVLIAPNGTIRSISRPAEALFSIENAQAAGKPFGMLFALKSQKVVADYLGGLADGGVASVLNDGREVIGREREGRFIPLFMTIGRLPEDTGFCAVLRDITPWKRAEEELTQSRARAERASSHKTEFLARVSHEIRTPLNAIIGFSELMLDEKFGAIANERYRDYLRDINRSGNHVLDLVNDLLDISKIEAGEQEMSYEAVALNETLTETIATMQPQANRERVIIRSSLAATLPDVVADLRSCRQIALNLLSNAVRYTPAGGQVIVSTSLEPSGDVALRVRDTGIGMSAGEIEQALKPFKQINALKRPRGDGTGLGLPLTKAMVEANRARFAITSTPGEGTLVEVIFPAGRVLGG